MRSLSLTMFLALACGCGSTGLTPAGSRIVAVAAVPSPGCETLGQVIGHGGGPISGGFTTNENIARSAINDATNRAAAMGATHLQASPPQFAASGKGSTTSATVTGVAYKCPPGSDAPTDASVTRGTAK